MEQKVPFISRAMLRAIKRNDTAIFCLPTTNACFSARSQVTHVQNADGYKLKCHIDFKEKKVVITRLS